MSALELIERDEQPTNVATLPVGSSSPVEMFRIAVQSGADMDQLERFMTLQTQWERREAEKAYSKAFAAFKSEAVRIIKNRSVTAGPLNGKKYAELFAVVNAVTPALSQYGLSASWKLTKDERDWLEVTCTLRHELGHSESVSMGGPPDAGGAKNKIQERASTITYLERYTLKAITGLSEQEDDDDGGHGGANGDALMQGFKDAAMSGTDELRKHYDKTQPDDQWWSKHSKELKAAAKVADAAGAQR